MQRILQTIEILVYPPDGIQIVENFRMSLMINIDITMLFILCTVLFNTVPYYVSVF